MSQAPSMPVFVDALIGDTLHLSAEEFGAYCLLLFATWRNNGQPLADNDDELARICRVSRAKWRKNFREKLVRFFDLSEGFWRQKRLEKEWGYVQQKAEVSRQNGSHGGRPRKTQRVFPENPSGSAQDTQTETTQPQPQPQPQPQSHTENLSQPAIGVSDPRDGDDPAGQAGRQADFEIFEDWIAEAAAEREAEGLPSVDLQEQARKLVDRWKHDPPNNPHDAWIGWALIARPDRANGAPHPNGQAPPRALTDEQAQWAARIHSWTSSGFWLPQWGPKPSEPGCHAPAEMVGEANKEREKAKGAAA